MFANTAYRHITYSVVGAMKILAKKLWEARIAVLPVTAFVLILGFSLGGTEPLDAAAFAAGAVLLIAGMTLCSFGSGISMEPMGEHIGASVTSTKKI